MPNALTIFGVCLGLSSIKFAIDLNYSMAVVAIGFAAILDTLDGRVARLIKGTSKVGKELDSLTDVISFGVAPGFVMYFWALNELGKFGWMFVLIYAVCCALRLARFNLTTIDESESWKINFFEGVPSPAAAGLVLLPLLIFFEYEFFLLNNGYLNFVNIIIVGFLMISKIPTFSIKSLNFNEKYKPWILLILILICIFLISKLWLTLVSIIIFYILTIFYTVYKNFI